MKPLKQHNTAPQPQHDRTQRKQPIKMLFLSFFLLSFTCQTLASFIKEDWKDSNDHLLTYDDTTGLSWLNVSATKGLTFVELQDKLLYNTDFSGFRLASFGEVNNLIDNIFTGPSPSSYANAKNYIDVVGYTSYVNNTYRLEALGASTTPSTNEYQYLGLTTLFAVEDQFSFLADRYNEVRLNNEAAATQSWGGYYLVSEVPEPTSVALLCVGLIGLGVLRYRQQPKFK